ncbi:GntR family transcriptional regulator [Prosthecobacter sp.]|jgi:GntR family transcriptional regulator|uniref:GntR family transcriptional regulator n=1 Tax=Prosthecobacter sp. TaxID=1965333 RepID=UPI003782F682
MLPFSIQLQDGSPVSDQILGAVRKALLTGQMRAGDAFPSVRTLSQELRISPTTAHKVVLLLKDAGWLNSRPGIGMVVTVPDQPNLKERLEQITPECRALLKEAAELNLTLEQVIKHLKSL